MVLAVDALPRSQWLAFHNKTNIAT